MKQIHIDVPSPQIVEAFCRKWKVREFALFGSVLRHDFGPGNDVDVLIEFAEDAHWSLYEWVDMQEELKALFGREVHLASKRGLRNPFRKHEILSTREVIYAA
jgi:predicted nucleotidyltransferase